MSNESHVFIHGCETRAGYIYNHLIPELERQGLTPRLYLDHNTTNLNAFVSSLRQLQSSPNRAAAWHLQDDVLPSQTFSTSIQKLDSTYSPSILIAGFASFYCKISPPGMVDVDNFWYSFPCLRLPPFIVDEFLYWYDNYFTIASSTKGTPYYGWVERGNMDDSIFKIFLQTREKSVVREDNGELLFTLAEGAAAPLQTYEIGYYNCAPNLVNHVDYLLGGSVINKGRRKKAVSLYWEEDEWLKEWERKVKKGK